MIVWFNDASSATVDACGGKGASLSRMAAQGLPVPPGFVVSAAAFRRFCDASNAAGAILEATNGLDVDDTSAIERASARLRDLIVSSPLPAEIGEAIRHAYRRLGTETRVAVRSSAIGEDGERASFAGQQETFLNVHSGAEVVRAVQECWASLFAPRAMFYRKKKGELADTRMAVVVQEMVLADKSGVMFTVDPVRGVRDHMVIEAVFGLGEGIVSGLITPDHYVIRRLDGSLVREFVATQSKAIVHGAGGGTVEVELPERDGAARVIGARQWNDLREMGLRLEQLFGAPQDIEWCIRGDDLFLLQSRPITNLSR
jgi:phosphoenolpyruvate synthase/pyruvate phosphate dikinase